MASGSIGDEMVGALAAFDATAPHSGRQTKVKSLVGFDPLLQDINAVDATSKVNSNDLSASSTLASASDETTQAREESVEGQSATMGQEEVTNELRLIAGKRFRMSPRRNRSSLEVPSESSKSKSPKAPNLSPKPKKHPFSLSPKRPSNSSKKPLGVVIGPINDPNTNQNPKFPWQKKLGRHRKSQSLSSTENTWKDVHIGLGGSSPGESNEDVFATAAKGIITFGSDNSPNSELSVKFSTKSTGVDSSSSSSNSNKFPWQKKKGRHRKTKSLNATALALSEVYSGQGSPKSKGNGLFQLSRASHSTTNSPIAPPPLTTSSPMIQEMWSVQKQQEEDQLSNLTVPCLAKPRATSFLTGKELVLQGQQDPANWQLEIPPKTEFDVSCKVSRFLESYHTEECLLDLKLLIGCSRLDLSTFAAGHSPPSTSQIAPCHRPVVESLLECGSDLQAVRGYFRSASGRQVLVLERQRQFLCVFAGTEAEQQNKVSKQPDTISLKREDKSQQVTVFADRYAAFLEFESSLLTLLEELTEENLFCDIVFSGHAFGAAMALLAAYRYAVARPELRCAALVTATPKVGLDDFRLSVHSLPNLKVMRVEYGRMESKSCAVGHCIRINPSAKPGVTLSVKAYKFSDGQDTTSVRSFFKRDKGGVADYVRVLEELDACKQSWVTSYYRQDGEGVRVKDNEARQMA